MKTRGQILYEAIQDYYVEHSVENSPLKNRCDWDIHPTALAKAAYEYAGDILIKDYLTETGYYDGCFVQEGDK